MTSEEREEHMLLLQLIQAHYADDADAWDAAGRRLERLYRRTGRGDLADWMRRQRLQPM